MSKTKEALIIIDMLRDFMEGDGALYCGKKARKIIPFIGKTISKFRKNKNLVIYANDSHKPGDREFKLFARHCVRGRPGSRVIKEVKPQRRDFIVPKTTYDAAYKTNLIKILKRHRIRDVYLAGVCTSICVMETATSLVRDGFRVKVLKRGVADSDAKAHDFALKRMRSLYGAKIL